MSVIHPVRTERERRPLLFSLFLLLLLLLLLLSTTKTCLLDEEKTTNTAIKLALCVCVCHHQGIPTSVSVYIPSLSYKSKVVLVGKESLAHDSRHFDGTQTTTRKKGGKKSIALSQS
jgi:hypothetical protein